MKESGRGMPVDVDARVASTSLVTGCLFLVLVSLFLWGCLSGPRPAERLDCGKVLWQGEGVEALQASPSPLRDGFTYGLVEVTFEIMKNPEPGTSAASDGSAGKETEEKLAEARDLILELEFLAGYGAWPSRAPRIAFYAQGGDPEDLCRLEVSSGRGEAGDAAKIVVVRGDADARYHTATFEWTPRRLAVSLDGTGLFDVDCGNAALPFYANEYQFMNPAKLVLGQGHSGIGMIRLYSLGLDAGLDKVKPSPCANIRIIDDGESRWLAWDPAKDDFGIATYRVHTGKDVSEELTQCRFKLSTEKEASGADGALDDSGEGAAGAKAPAISVIARDRAGNESVSLYGGF